MIHRLGRGLGEQQQQDEDDGGTRLRVATANIQHGLPGDPPADPRARTAPRARRAVEDGLLRAFADVDVDLLALQEVDVGQPRSGLVDQAALVARATGLRHYRFAAAVDGDVRRGRARAAVTTATPGYGVALLSRHPVLAWFAQPLPGPTTAPVPDEPRVALAAVVLLPGGLLCAASTHLSRGPVARRQLTVVRRRLLGLASRAGPGRREPLPALLLGDLNMAPRAVAAGAGAGALLARGLTHPAPEPLRQPDHVIGFGGVVPDGGGAAVRLAVSDHRMLTVPVRVLRARGL